MSGEKTEEPTQKKIDDARKEGQLPQRKNVIEALFLSFSIILLTGMAESISKKVMSIFESVFRAIETGLDEGIGHVKIGISEIAIVFITFVVVTSIFTLLLGLQLNKFNFAPKAMSPKFNKLNPVNGLKSLFSKNTLYNFCRTLIYFVALSFTLYFSIANNIPDVVNASHCGASCLAPLFLGYFRNLISLILIALLLLALADIKIQNLLFLKQNMMSKEDIKNEFKGQEGDPQIKGARKSIALQEANMPTLTDATHVVYGESFLVAIIYYPETKSLPFMVAKARGGTIKKTLKRCRSYGLQVFNLPSVARDFHLMAAPGSYLPARSAVGMHRVIMLSQTQSQQ